MVNILGVMIDFYYYLRVGVRKESLELFRIESLYIEQDAMERTLRRRGGGTD